MASLRSIASCIGISGNFSIVQDFYGYPTRVYGHVDLSTDLAAAGPDAVKIDPTAPGSLSLLNQVKLLQGPHVNLDIVAVGPEDFTTTDEQEVDIAVQITRELYARIGLGIGRVLRWQIPKSDANGFTVIDSECEGIDLIDEWYAPGGGMDVFFVRDIDFGKQGATPSKDPEGTIIELEGNISSGIALAHELGHYLGLDHHAGEANLMYGEGFPKPNYDLTSDQANQMKSSAFVEGGCA